MTEIDTVVNRFVTNGPSIFQAKRPHHTLIPFSAKRKAHGFDQNVSLDAQNTVNGTLSNLYSRIDLLATSGHPRHEAFKSAVDDIIGIPITTKASVGGKEAGFYFDIGSFVTLDRMGDGVSEMVALIVELCLEDGKVFVLEEPETNLHPTGLKRLLSLVRESATRNQFFIATHSNIVLRDLGAEIDTKIFRTYRREFTPQSTSYVEEVPANTREHMDVLRDLGYEFADLDLYDGWLFLEESSAETIFREVLIPLIFPRLSRRLRTFSARGASNLKSSLVEFKRLITFVHLQSAYEGRVWVRADGDDAGREAISSIKSTFSSLGDCAAESFSEGDFERFYPKIFSEEIDQVLGITDKKARNEAKFKLLEKVLSWTKLNEVEAVEAWRQSAREPIALLEKIEEAIIA